MVTHTLAEPEVKTTSISPSAIIISTLIAGNLVVLALLGLVYMAL
jgi:hypothetical protein